MLIALPQLGKYANFKPHFAFGLHLVLEFLLVSGGILVWRVEAVRLVGLGFLVLQF